MPKRIEGRSAITAIVVAMVLFTHADSARAQDNDPVSAARFAISIDGVQIGVFAQLVSEADLETGAARHAITLTGGRTLGLEMAAWHELVILGDAAARKSATIVVYNSSGSPVTRYHLENAWPAKISLDGSGRGLRTATLMLMYDVLRVQVE